MTAAGQNSLDPGGREEGIAQDLLGLLADSVDAPGPLDKSDDGPREVEVNDDCAILEVLPFAQDVRRHQDAKLLGGRDPVTLAVTHGAEAPGVARRVLRLASYASKALNAPLR